MVRRDFVDIADLLAAGQWHASVMAPLVRVVERGGDAQSAPVVIADAAVENLDVGETPDIDPLQLVVGWLYRASDSELMALIALGAAPVSPRRRRPDPA